MPRAPQPARRRRILRTVVAVLALSLLTAGCLRPGGGPPGENGRFPDAALTVISPQCRVVNDIADQLRALMSTALSQGVALIPETASFLPPGVPGPPVIESCYRSYDMQVWWRNYYCSIGHCGMAAVPGTSKHGWGRAVDFQDHLGELTFSSPGYVWLQANAWAFGFSQPPSVQQGGPNAEAWHWEA